MLLIFISHINKVKEKIRIESKKKESNKISNIHNDFI